MFWVVPKMINVTVWLFISSRYWLTALEEGAAKIFNVIKF